MGKPVSAPQPATDPDWLANYLNMCDEAMLTPYYMPQITGSKQEFLASGWGLATMKFNIRDYDGEAFAANKYVFSVKLESLDASPSAYYQLWRESGAFPVYAAYNVPIMPSGKLMLVGVSAEPCPTDWRTQLGLDASQRAPTLVGNALDFEVCRHEPRTRPRLIWCEVEQGHMDMTITAQSYEEAVKKASGQFGVEFKVKDFGLSAGGAAEGQDTRGSKIEKSYTVRLPRANLVVTYGPTGQCIKARNLK